MTNEKFWNLVDRLEAANFDKFEQIPILAELVYDNKGDWFESSEDLSLLYGDKINNQVLKTLRQLCIQYSAVGAKTFKAEYFA